MQQRMPTVKGGRLYQSETDGDPILVGTPAWYDWLEHHTAFTFVDSVGTFHARKQGNGVDDLKWKAYCTLSGKLYCVHLGQSDALVLGRMLVAARMLAGEPSQIESVKVFPAESVVSMHSIPRTAGNLGSPGSLMRTKLYPPRRLSDLISRAHLIKHLDDGLSGIVTLLSAPAGFGKTTLLTQWLQTIDRQAAWLSLDENDNELRTFVHSLTTSLQTIFPDAFQASASLLMAPRIPPPAQIATLLINDLADLPEDVVLVLDNYQLISASEVHTLLEQLIGYLPPQLHLVLSTRSDPPLPLARWRARGHLNELRHIDLRFTLEETEAFLAGILGNEATREIAFVLEELTEGWIAILRLAALSLRNTFDRTAFIERLRHYPDHSISSYLVEEILSQQVPIVQNFLMQISILEQINVELCSATLGSDFSYEQIQATLNWLERTNIVIILDDRQVWYRFHHLFQQLLQEQLRERMHKDEIAILYQRASAWYEEQGLNEEAIRYALAGGDESSAKHLVEAQLVWAFEHEQWVQLERWLGPLPEELIQGSPGLLVARAWILQAHGQLIGLPQLLTTAEQLLCADGNSANNADDRQSRILHAMIANTWSYVHYFTGKVQESLESARSALEWIPPGEEYLASFAQQYLAWSSQASGQELVAIVELQKALHEQSAHPNSIARLLLAQALIYLAAGKLSQLEHTARHLLHIAQEAGLATSQYWAHWYLGVVHYERNNLDAAVFHFSVVIANQHHAHFWAMQDALCGLALAYQAQGSGIKAQKIARALIELVQEEHNMRHLMTAYAFCGRLALLQNDVETAEQWLEMAGDQVLLVGPMASFEVPAITKARLLLAKGDDMSIEQGHAQLKDLLQHFQVTHNTRKTIKVLALQAWAYDLQERATEALDVLESALVLARPGGFIRTFADFPALVKVLHELRKRRKARHEVDGKLDIYLQGILAAMGPMTAPSMSMKDLLQQEGIESLTDRELQILALLDKNLTNKEIARELVVTPGTVKVHTNNVYRKLNVNNRRAAVTLAKALGLLAEDPNSKIRLP